MGIIVVFLCFGPTAAFAGQNADAPAPTNRTEIKQLLDTALFSPTWRWPDMTVDWVVRLDKIVPVVMTASSETEPEEFGAAFERLDKALSYVQSRIGFPRVDPDIGLLTFDEFAAGWKEGAPFVLIFPEPPDVFANEISFISEKLGGSLMNPERYIERGCFFPPGSSRDGIKKGAMGGFVVSTLPNERFEACVSDILYNAHGIWEEDAPRKDIVLKIMYDPMVKPGMTREALFELVDHGVFDHLLEK